MTLTHLIPTLRASIPDPFDPRLWPTGATATTVDMLVDGVSLLHVAQLGGTPSVVTARHPGSPGSGSGSVMVVRVVALAQHLDGEAVVFVDGDPEAAGAVWREARLIGRISTARDRTMVVRPAPPYGTPRTRSMAQLPLDLREGDLIAMPCTVRSAVGRIPAHSDSTGGLRLPI